MNGDDEDMCDEEREILCEIKEIKDKIEQKRAEVRDSDFINITDNIPELGRLKFKIRRNLRGHLAKVNDLDWGSDGQMMVSASQDGKLIVWDTHSANKLHMIPLKTAWVIGCAYSNNMSLIASGGLDNLCSVFSVDVDKETPERPIRELIGHDGYISSCEFFDNDTLITGSGDKTLIKWDIETSKSIDAFKGHLNDVTSFALNNDKTNMVSVSTDHTARLWDLRKPGISACIQLFEGHTQDINGVSFFPNNSYAFITSSDDGSCRLWDIRADQTIASYVDDYVQCGATCCTISKSGRLLIAGYDDYNCHVWDVLREERVGVMPAHEDRVSCVKISPDGVAVASGAWDSNCLVWTAK